MQPVKALLTEGSRTILQSGVSAGQMVVVDGADRLRPGSKVDARQAPARPTTATSPQQPGTAGSTSGTDRSLRSNTHAGKKARQQ